MQKWAEPPPLPPLPPPSPHSNPLLLHSHSWWLYAETTLSSPQIPVAILSGDGFCSCCPSGRALGNGGKALSPQGSCLLPSPFHSQNTAPSLLACYHCRPTDQVSRGHVRIFYLLVILLECFSCIVESLVSEAANTNFTFIPLADKTCFGTCRLSVLRLKWTRQHCLEPQTALRSSLPTHEILHKALSSSVAIVESFHHLSTVLLLT